MKRPTIKSKHAEKTIKIHDIIAYFLSECWKKSKFKTYSFRVLQKKFYFSFHHDKLLYLWPPQLGTTSTPFSAIMLDLFLNVIWTINLLDKIAIQSGWLIVISLKLTKFREFPERLHSLTTVIVLGDGGLPRSCHGTYRGRPPSPSTISGWSRISQRSHQHLREGAVLPYFTNFSRNYMKMKEFGSQSGAHPLSSSSRSAIALVQ